MKKLLFGLAALIIVAATPAYAQTSATVQTETTVRATTSTSSTGAGVGTAGGTSVTTEPEEASDMFLEIKGVEGESDEKKGNVEMEWKVEEGESAARDLGKPKYEDIKASMDDASDDGEDRLRNSGPQDGWPAVAVSAVEVRGWDPKEKQEFLATVKTHAQVQSEQDLENFAKGVLLENAAMEEVAFNFDKIEMKHQSSGKLFGFIPLTFTQKVEVDTEGEDAGRVKVKMPWYSFLLKADVSADVLEEESEKSISENLGNNENWDFGGQAEILALVSNVLKTKHDTAKNSVGNIR